jgi:hypothetical protein
MKPWIHCQNSVRRHGGAPSDYQLIHNFLDSSKAHHADMRHRAIFHNSMGPYVAELIFGIPHQELDAAAERFSWSEEEKRMVLYLIGLSKTSQVTSFKNSDNKTIQIRDIAEDHIMEDLGRIPSVSEYLDLLPLDPCFRRPQQSYTIKIEKENNYASTESL